MKTIDEFRKKVKDYIDEGKPQITQSSLAKETGVPQYAISRLLSGSDMPGRYLLPLQSYMDCHKK